MIEDDDIQRCALSVLEEACFDEVSINFLLEDKNIHKIIKSQYQHINKDKIQNGNSHKDNHDMFIYNDIDILITKFLRSEKGFKILKDNGWIDYKIQNWN
jgi:hypothetical protein